MTVLAVLTAALAGAVLVTALLSYRPARSRRDPSPWARPVRLDGLPVLRRRRRRRAVEEELPEVLDLLVGALRSGYGLLPALGLAAEQGEQGMPVLAGEFRRLLRAVQLGRPVQAALGDLADRNGHPDLTIAVTAIQLAHEIGGSLSDVLTVVRDTVLARQRLQRQIRVLTVQARLSGWIVAMLPPGMLTLITAVNPAFTAVLWTDAAGQWILALAAGLTLLGGLVIFWLLREAGAP